MIVANAIRHGHWGSIEFDLSNQDGKDAMLGKEILAKEAKEQSLRFFEFV